MKNQKNTTETKIRFKFFKRGEYKYLSHLDIIKIIIRAIRRAGIKIKYSGGYNPKPKINFGPPTPLGIESAAEYCDVIIMEDIEENMFCQMVNLQLKPLINLTDAKKVAMKLPSLMEDIAVCLYSFKLVTHSGKNLIDSFPKNVENELRNRSDFSPSVFDLKINRESKDTVFLKLFGYAKILKKKNNEIFKFNYFLDFFQNWIKDYRLGIDYMVKEEMYVFRGGLLKTPLEII